MDMKNEPSLLRKLRPIEQAFTISNEADPLCVVCVLFLTSGPEIRDLKIALAKLQARHPLLQAGITKTGGSFYFGQPDPVPPLKLEVVERSDGESWRSAAEQFLNTTFDKSGPLMKCRYLPSPDGTNAELLVCFHHAIIDGHSARLMLHELLSLSGGIPLPAAPSGKVTPEFPAAFRGWNLLRQLSALGGRQLKEEQRYRKAGLTAPIPAHSRNATISLRLSPSLSRQLTVRIGREGLSLNSVLLAAITQAVVRRRHADADNALARVISFADLRPAMSPPLEDQRLGCHISMLRLSVPVSKTQSAGQLSEEIRRSIFKASRQGDVFLMSLISKYLIRMALTMKNMRLGVSAISFIGKLELNPQYGKIRLHNVEAFITNNRFGPEFSAFGKVLFGAIGLDFTYLTAEMTAAEAREIVQEIEAILVKMAKST